MKKWKQHLTKRDKAVIKFVARYKAVTLDMVATRFFEGQTEKNAGRVIKRLVDRGLLRRVPYFPPRSYVAPTGRGIRTIGFPDFPPRPLTEQSLPVALAVAWYCVQENVERFTNKEFQATFPELWRSALKSSSYYVRETDTGRRLGLFVIDRGGAARRIKGKIKRLVRQRESIPEFMDLIRARRFRVTVLTGMESQKEAIRKQLGRDSFRRVEVETAFIAELGELLTAR